ncbi:MAG TPA: hypothetical protein PKN09_13270 [Novosphingobium sp.]|nr:hypothetical protein [Novosphingobium sp.]
MSTAMIVSVIGLLGVLVLNWRAFLGDSAAAGNTGKQKLIMALIWVVIIIGVTLVIGYLQALKST